MKYNFINYEDNRPFFTMEGDYNTIAENNSVKIGNTTYIIEHVQNVLKRFDVYPYIGVGEVNVYIKNKEDYYD